MKILNHNTVLFVLRVNLTMYKGRPPGIKKEYCRVQWIERHHVWEVSCPKCFMSFIISYLRSKEPPGVHVLYMYAAKIIYIYFLLLFKKSRTDCIPFRIILHLVQQ